MALSIIINKVVVADSFAAGTKVADIVVSGGTSPYSYSLASGEDYFQISGTEVQVINGMDISNIQSFSVTATDSTSGIALTVTSEETYPNLIAKIQSRFNSANKIYKITQDIDLGHGVLTIPTGCTLDFQGGSFNNGIVISNNTTIKGNPKDSSLFGAFWETNGKLYGSLIDYTKDTPDSILPYYPIHSDISEAYSDIKPSYSSGMCMNNNYIFTFSISDKSTTAPDYKSIFCVNDHNGNLISSGIINMGGHVNDAAILDDSIIVPCTENGTITKFLISDLINGNNNVVNGTTFIKDSCYALDVDNDFIYTISPGYVRQYDITGTVLIRTFNINIENGGPFANNTDYSITNQAVVVKNGILYVNESIRAASILDGYATAIYDLATESPITIQPIKINSIEGESEGLCKYNDNIYMSVFVRSINRFFNMLYKLPSLRRDTITSGLSLTNSSLFSYSDISSIIIYVDNTYSGKSDGSSNRPFKNFEDAFSMITSTMKGYTISVKTTSTYNGFHLTNISIPIIIDFNNSTISNTDITIQFCNNIYIRNATFNNTKLNIYKSKIDVYNIKFNNALLEEDTVGISITGNSIVSIIQANFTNLDTAVSVSSSIITDIRNCTFNNINNFCTITNSIVNSAQTFTKDKLLELKSYPFNGNNCTLILTGTSMVYSSNDISDITDYYNTLPASSVLANSKIRWGNGYIIDGVWIQKNEGNYSGIFVRYDGYPINAPTMSSSNLDFSGKGGRKDGFQYFNSASKKILTYMSGYYYDAYGNKDVNLSGPSDSRPNSSDIIIGFQYFDTTLNKPIYWSGSKWVDATGADI